MTHAPVEVGKNIKNAAVRQCKMPLIPRGFKFAGISAGIKKKNIKDLALIYTETPAIASAVFTKNRVKAAPIIYSQNIISRNKISAILINSGCANACTGKEGIKNVELICENLTRAMNLPSRSVIMASTGVIGEQLPLKKILQHIPVLAKNLSPEGLKDAAEAILTTDKTSKIASTKIKLTGGDAIITGFAKGAGMIQPNMATMLAFILTDAKIPEALLKRSLKTAVDNSFNRITVDGDMSTNDTVVLLANGSSSGSVKKSSDFESFVKALTDLCYKLALMIVSDGEGATHVVQIKVKSAKTESDAKRIAYKIANSPLVKTALYGKDPNWGRIMAAAGASGTRFDPEKIDIFFNNVQVVQKGIGTGNDSTAKKVMEKKNYTITIDLHEGKREFSVYTTDLTYEYIRINASYKS